jgi:hypothetical protein
MKRALLALVVAATLPAAAACGPSFKDRRTPSGDFCSDMAVVPAGQEPDREYHRLQPIQSDPKAKTEAERLESLRKAACNVGADAVIEAVNEEVRGENAQYGTVSSGTAVIWLHHADAATRPAGPVPLGAAQGAPASGSLPTKGAVAAPPAPPPPPDATTAAPPAKTAAKPPAKPPVLKVLMRPATTASTPPPPPPPPPSQ